MAKKLNENKEAGTGAKYKLTQAQRKIDDTQKELDEMKSKAGCSVAANKGWAFLCTAAGQCYRRSG